MRKETFCEVLGNISERYIQEAHAAPRAGASVLRKWGAAAACLCLAAVLALSAGFLRPAETPEAATSPADGPPSLAVNGVTYFISPHLAVSDQLPDGFTYAGEANAGGYSDCPYFTNSEMPEWIYVYHEVMTDGTVDASGTLNRTEPHNAYVRYVDERLRGKDLVSCGGDQFISLWSAQTYGDAPDVSEEAFRAAESAYGVRLEGEVPEGFVSVGTAVFSGDDTIPHGPLASNRGACEVFVNPAEPDVILVSAQWYTAPDEAGETRHEGFDVYLRCDGPLV